MRRETNHMSNIYTLEKLIKIIRNPGELETAINQIRKDTRAAVEKAVHASQYKNQEVDILLRDWDNLIILDACRYDLLESVYPRDVDKYISVAGNTKEFIRETMNGRELFDTIYVSANAHTDLTLEEGVFQEVIKTYDFTWEMGKHNDHGQLHPQNTYQIAKNSIQDHPDKRAIVHFVQPHSPYFGKKARKIRERLRQRKNFSFNLGEKNNRDINYPNLLYAAKDGHITDDELREVYTENLELALKYVEKLLDEMEGKTAISADHGESLGDASTLFSPAYGHGGYAPEVRTVPWVKVNGGDRKKVIRESQVEPRQVDEEVVTEQLKQLGYL